MRALLLGIALLSFGCASSPPADQEFSLVAVTPSLRDASAERVEGAACTLANDKGAWTVTTPATARVLRSTHPLEVRCTKPGFQPSAISLQCVEQPTTSGEVGSALMSLGPGIALLSAPFAIPLSMQHMCVYKSIFIWMMPQ